MPNRVMVAEQCDATGDARNTATWFQNQYIDTWHLKKCLQSAWEIDHYLRCKIRVGSSGVVGMHADERN